MSNEKGTLSIEEQGIDTISEEERKGTPASLFWPWFAANVSMFAMSYGAWALGFGISFWQATAMTIIGVVISFLLVGIISIAGKRGNAPTMVLTRATFGVEGAKVPAALSWIATLGWEISLTTTAVLALSSTIEKLGWGSGVAPKIISTIVVVGLVVVAGIFGYDLIMRCQQVITIVTGVITVGFFILGWGHIDFSAIDSVPAGSLPAMLGCCFFVMTGFGFSNADMAENVGNDPIGAMASILPTWYLIPYTIVAVLGLMSGSIMDNYSNGLALLSFGVKLPRTVAAALTAALTVLGVVYVTFFSDTFIGPFQGFLTTLGVPMAVWAGMFVADVIIRKKDYSTADLYDPKGRYGAWNGKSFAILVVGTVLGWGLVVNTAASWLNWQGYLLFLIGGKEGSWAAANLGVIVALIIGLAGSLMFQRGDIAKQEADLPVSEA